MLVGLLLALGLSAVSSASPEPKRPGPFTLNGSSGADEISAKASDRGRYVFRSENGAFGEPSGRCERRSPRRIVCPPGEVTAINLSLVDGRDVARITPSVEVRTRLTGGRGADELLGGSARDAIDGGPGADRLSGARGDDRLEGKGGDDKLLGGPGDDLLAGGAGSDRCDGGGGDNTIKGC